ncbi:MAG TPA: fasciclin domain-containing protein [Adhaeribacter sp.]|nr:fasciclin domain-containing protein [Adhaeribacter sp.]
MKKNIQNLFLLLLLLLALPQFSQAQSEKRITELICDSRPLLKQAILEGGVSGVLMADGPYTFFAPAEAALQDMAGYDQGKLNALLSNHIVPGKILTQDLKDGSKLTTLGGGSLSVFRKGDKILINGIEITAGDQVARNGVVHTVRKWLITPEQKSDRIGMLR